MKEKVYPVTFIGAGPGDPELITVKGQRALMESDVIFYAGSLVNETILRWGKKEAVKINTASMALNEIVDGITTAYMEGKRVARLHSGDPALYGAIQEQIRLLKKAGVKYKVIPGVSASFAAAASLGIELTIPEVTQTVILTRASGRTPVPDKEKLSSLASHRATLALYLSVQQVEKIAKELAEAYGEDFPVAVAYRVSWEDEQIILGTLKDISQKVKDAGITRQALILVTPGLREGEDETRSKLYDEKFSHGYRNTT